MSIILYLLKASISLMLFYFMYRLVFISLTFFRFNRIYLLFSFLASFLLPFVSLPVRTSGEGFMDYSIGIDWEQLVQVSDSAEKLGAETSSFSYFYVIFSLYFLISAYRLIRSVWQYLRVRKSYSDGYIETHRKIRWNIHPKIEAPFTMFRTVYLDEQTYEQENSPVIRHEMVHARQLHSVDLLITEIICAFLWFNPFVFLLKRQVRENHEYLADRSAHSAPEELIGFMQALSSELTRNLDPAVASYFQSSTLKKRVIMLTNKRSNKRKLGLYLAILPLIGLLTMAFQQPAEFLLNESALVQLVKGQSAVPVMSNSGGIPSMFPLDEKFQELITWGYGVEAKNPITGDMKVHKGVDIAAPLGTPIYASADGVVAKATSHEGYGNVIILAHEDQFSSLYAHLDSFDVEKGMEVKKGDRIGTVGNTGMSTGPHLHYEVMKAGENVDPADYYND